MRPFCEADAESTRRIWLESTRRSCAGVYTYGDVSAMTQEKDLDSWLWGFYGRASYVAEEDGKVVGFASVNRGAELECLYVDVLKQRRGIGRRLLREVEGDAVKRGAPDLRVDALKTSYIFYEKCGYDNLGIGRRFFFGHPVDIIRMRKSFGKRKFLARIRYCFWRASNAIL